MSRKKVFALRLDEDVYASLEKWASDEFRSTNGQIEWIITMALRKAGRNKVNKSEDLPKDELE